MKTRIIVKDVLAPLRHLLKKLPEKNVVLILSLVVGVACGFAAVILKSAVEFIHHGLISWFDSEAYNYLYLVYPGIGMLIAMLFVRYVVKDNIGHGVTKVLLAVSKNESKIRASAGTMTFTSTRAMTGRITDASNSVIAAMNFPAI